VASGGLNGLSIGVTTVGAVLVYAGFRGVSPLQVFKEVSSGKLAPVTGKPTPDVVPGVTPPPSGFGDARRSAVVAAAQKYTGDTYSQLKRTQPGFSDCSSFVDKALRDAGIKPPVTQWANTVNYASSPEWRTIPTSQVQPGDIAIGPGHMVLVTAAGGTQGIGQQRPNVNVRTGSMATLFGKVPYVFKTWTGYAKGGAAGEGSGNGGGGSW